MEEYYQNLIIDYAEKRISDRGLAELREWVEQSPENLSQFRNTLKVLESAKQYFKKEPAPQRVWDAIEHQIQNSQQSHPIINPATPYTWMAYAAIVLLVSAIVLFFHENLFQARPTNPVFTEIRNPNGKRSRVTLPDGSVIFLNAASMIKYEKSFDAAVREVYLEGEAFFDVEHDQSRPFIVKSGTVNTTVLGTSFNIRAFKDDGKVAVTVQSGKVGVTLSRDGSQKFLQYLLPGQQLDINAVNGDYSFNTLNASNAAAWKDSKIVFDNKPLDEIALTLERWYNIKVELSHPQHSTSGYTAKFDNLPLNQVMDILSQLTGCSYSFQQNKLIINNKNCK